MCVRQREPDWEGGHPLFFERVVSICVSGLIDVCLVCMSCSCDLKLVMFVCVCVLRVCAW